MRAFNTIFPSSTNESVDHITSGTNAAAAARSWRRALNAAAHSPTAVNETSGSARGTSVHGITAMLTTTSAATLEMRIARLTIRRAAGTRLAMLRRCGHLASTHAIAATKSAIPTNIFSIRMPLPIGSSNPIPWT